MTTPVRRQYLRIKNEHKNAILLFRLGDFFETFDDDARIVSRELEIALTSREMGRGNRVPLAGIPCHSLEPHLARLIKQGYKVAICEQTSDPSTSKGLVDREVVRVVTPGTVIEDSILDQKVNNYLAAAVVEGGYAGLAYVDITTGDFSVSQFKVHLLAVELSRIAPSEILIAQDQEALYDEHLPTTFLEPDAFNLEWATKSLINHFGVVSLQAYGCERLPLAVSAAGAILDYLTKNQKASLVSLTSLHTYSTDSYMVLEPQTRRNLELFEGGRWGNDTTASLLAVLDQTRTSMGGRLLRRWLGQPLLNVGDILRRQDAVAWFHQNGILRGRVSALLDSISDLERIINKVRNDSATPRDLVALRQSLTTAPQIKEIMADRHAVGEISWLADGIDDHKVVVEAISNAIVDSPPVSVGQGQVIREGFSSDLDDLRNTSRNAQEYIAGLQNKERERTGIRSLKVGFNKVFGYYIEVSKSNIAQVPEEYIRRQTLVGGERYVTPEMKEHESLILSAQERVDELEGVLYREVCEQVVKVSSDVIDTAQTISKVDVFYSLGEVASQRGYVRPAVDSSDIVDIREGRHPVVERTMAAGSFVPNDVRLSNMDEQLIILTGPNMSGKSTYIRQVAIIVLMAQVGSYVPASSATVGLVDRIFTRVGLQDDLAVGQSTFMIEMLETAMIINQATSQSLVVLDEIGRGTSTYDGLAIAQAVAEYIHSHPKLGCKTLFATHYHELTRLAEILPRVRNYNVAVSEDQGDVVFLRRILPGVADKSYGVYVARLAGLPAAVIQRAWKVLNELENGGPSHLPESRKSDRENALSQQRLFKDPYQMVAESLLGLDVASMTPLEAINKLYELQENLTSNV